MRPSCIWDLSLACSAGAKRAALTKTRRSVVCAPEATTERVQRGGRIPQLSNSTRQNSGRVTRRQLQGLRKYINGRSNEIDPYCLIETFIADKKKCREPSDSDGGGPEEPEWWSPEATATCCVGRGNQEQPTSSGDVQGYPRMVCGDDPMYAATPQY